MIRFMGKVAEDALYMYYADKIKFDELIMSRNGQSRLLKFQIKHKNGNTYYNVL